MTDVGIDLGTTNSLIGYFSKNKVSLIPNDRGKMLTPSVVAYRDGEVLVGEAAKNQAVLNPAGTVLHAKRLMGTPHVWKIGDKSVTPAEVSAQVLSYLRHFAGSYLDEELQKAVITVPAYFSEPQRKDTLEAALMAGFTQARLINEPTAAALAWAFEENRRDGLFLVYDLGGGTFDVSLVSVRGPEYRVLATSGDANLGGMDFDQLLYDRALRSFRAEAGTMTDPAVLQQVSLLSEQLKIDLSTQKSAAMVLPFAGKKASAHLEFKMDRDGWEELLNPYVERTLALCAQVLASAGVEVSQLTDLVFSGGSTRIPLVRRKVEAWAKLRGAPAFHPEEAVCRGAAQFASLREEGRGESIHDVTAFDLGLEVEGGSFFPLLEANTPIPSQVQRQFTTVEDDQTVVEIHVQQRHDSDVSSLGKFLLGGIPPQPKNLPRIDVSFSLNSDGILNVQARETATGATQELLITNLPIAGHSQNWEELEKLIESASAVSWDKMPLGMLKWKKDWVTQLTGARTVLTRRDASQLESSAYALQSLLDELGATPRETLLDIHGKKPDF